MQKVPLNLFLIMIKNSAMHDFFFFFFQRYLRAYDDFPLTMAMILYMYFFRTTSSSSFVPFIANHKFWTRNIITDANQISIVSVEP